MQIINNKTRNEHKLYNEATFELFYLLAAKLESKMLINFDSKIDDFDELFWTFKYKNQQMILNYSTFDGISIYKRGNNLNNEQDEIYILQEIKNEIQKII